MVQLWLVLEKLHVRVENSGWEEEASPRASVRRSERRCRAPYLVVHVVEVQGLPKGCLHFLLHVLIAHGPNKRDNPARREKH